MMDQVYQVRLHLNEGQSSVKSVIFLAEPDKLDTILALTWYSIYYINFLLHNVLLYIYI